MNNPTIKLSISIVCQFVIIVANVWQVWLVADLTFPDLSVCMKIQKILHCLRATAPAINYTCG